jgi:hypothetical protein
MTGFYAAVENLVNRSRNKALRQAKGLFDNVSVIAAASKMPQTGV